MVKMSVQEKLGLCLQDLGQERYDVGGYITQNFDICASSGSTLKKLAKQGDLSCTQLREVAELEDAFLQLERDSMCNYLQTEKAVCNDVSAAMTDLSATIKERSGDSHCYHGVHIAQGRTCDAGAPSNNMTKEFLCQ